MGPDAPVLILGDINVEPEASPVLSQAIAKGLIRDLQWVSKLAQLFFQHMARLVVWMLPWLQKPQQQLVPQ
jgi:hypothetical protein